MLRVVKQVTKVTKWERKKMIQQKSIICILFKPRFVSLSVCVCVGRACVYVFYINCEKGIGFILCMCFFSPKKDGTHRSFQETNFLHFYVFNLCPDLPWQYPFIFEREFFFIEISKSVNNILSMFFRQSVITCTSIQKSSCSTTMSLKMYLRLR